MPTIKNHKNHSIAFFISVDNKTHKLLQQSQIKNYDNSITRAIDNKSTHHYLLQCRYDLILLDLESTEINALDVIKTIQQPGSPNRNTAIIAITVQKGLQQQKQMIAAGFDACLIKPLQLEALEETLSLWLTATKKFNHQTDTFDYVTALLNKTSGNSSLARVILNKLFIELPEQIQLIEQAIASADLDLAETVTHKLHGSLCFCGFTDLQALASNLETSFSQNNPSLISTNFNLLKNKVNEFIALKDSTLEQL